MKAECIIVVIFAVPKYPGYLFNIVPGLSLERDINTVIQRLNTSRILMLLTRNARETSIDTFKA